MKAIDLFAGWGGFTAGAHAAGVDVVWAANHWPLAVRAHAANHPKTRHVCQDLRQADWSALPQHDLLLASPACQGHSQAAQPSRARSDGTRRHHDKLRATAWAVVDCVEVCHPRAFVVENVPDFQNWNKYDLWLESLRREGYQVSEHRLVASRLGVPQRRDRLFVVGLLGYRPLRLPQPRGREPGFGRCVQWRQGEWRAIASVRHPNAKRRLLAAAKTFGRAMVQHVSHHNGLPLSEPIRTITTKDQWAVVDGPRYRPLTIRENARAMGFPDRYRWPDDATRRETIAGLGNAVCPPVASWLLRHVREAA